MNNDCIIVHAGWLKWFNETEPSSVLFFTCAIPAMTSQNICHEKVNYCDLPTKLGSSTPYKRPAKSLLRAPGPLIWSQKTESS